MTLPSLDKLNAMKTLWTAAMPPECSLASDFDFLFWAETYSTSDIESAIVRTAAKMRLNVRAGIELVPQAAQRYCSSVLANKVKGRLRRQG
jgi:hypothetical protein